MYRGIDVSQHNGIIDWKKVKNDKIDFAIIRAGYGQNNVDTMLYKNISGCKNNNIPFGLYWFSYALNENMAIKEANYIADIADKYYPDFPLVFDWEYASEEFANKKEIVFDNDGRKKIALAFLIRIEERGYTPMLYSNPDYLNKGFKELANKYDFWLALWAKNRPTIKHEIWQATATGKVAGIGTDVDINYSDIMYNRKEDINMSESEKNEFIRELLAVYKKYIH